MTVTGLAKQYDVLTAEERFRLILSASGRGDDADRDRLVRSAPTITSTMPHHSPFAQAFEDVASFTFMELVDDAARFLDMLNRSGAATDLFGDDGKSDGKASPGYRYFLIARAAAHVLGVKVDGWQQFCDGLGVPGLLVWGVYPGFERLQETLARAAAVAFSAEEMLAWRNDKRPAGIPAQTAVSLTAEAFAADLETVFRQRVGWWGG